MKRRQIKSQQRNIGLVVITILDRIINTIVLLFFLILFLYSIYAIWDSQQLYKAADAAKYHSYKPVREDTLSFSELQTMNPDVLGWLSVYGTNIDYPLVQGENNDSYINTAVTGEYALSGSIFLDHRNNRDFSDFNTIIYGHHMEKKKMFGEIGLFTEKKFFEEHQYGSLFYGGKEHGLEFFAFMEVDAYTQNIYLPKLLSEQEKQEYLTYIREYAMYQRPLDLSEKDRIVLLSTCTTDMTNGRHLLIGKITDNTYSNPFAKESESQHDQVDIYSSWNWGIAAIGIVVLVSGIILFYKRKKNHKD